MSKTGRIIQLAAVAAAVGGLGYWLTTGSSAKPQDKPAARPPVPVMAAQAVTRDMPAVLQLVGRAEAYESVTVRARVDGQVKLVSYSEGRHVRIGEPLLELDPADFAARLRQAEANQARDQAQFANAQAEVARYVSLHKQGFVSEEKVNEVRTNAAAMQAGVEADHAAAEVARLQLGYCRVRAPIAGILGARLVFPGSAVKINDTALAVINRVDPLYVTFSMPEKYLPRLKPLLDEGALKVIVNLPGDPAHTLEGTARFLDNMVDAATGTIQMKARLDNHDEHLTPGQFLNLSLTLETLKGAVTVPAEAIQQGPEGSLAFVIGADDKAQPRKVELAFVREGVAVIASGLKAGETVVTDGLVRLTPGAKVKVKGK